MEENKKGFNNIKKTIEIAFNVIVLIIVSTIILMTMIVIGSYLSLELFFLKISVVVLITFGLGQIIIIYLKKRREQQRDEFINELVIKKKKKK